MKHFSWAVLAILAVQASGARTGRLGSKPHVNSTAGAAEPFRKPDSKELERMKEAINSTLANFADMGFTAPDPTQYGPYDMEAHVDIPVTGFSGCSAPYLGNIYLPIARAGGATPPPAPIIAFAHGFSQGAQMVDLTHRNDLFRPLVAMGFAIVAHQTGGLVDYCDSSHDQVQMLTWAKGSTYASRIDFSTAVLAGFSMGGRATLKNSADASVVAANNFTAVLAFMPHCSYGCGIPTLPTHFFAGDMDGVAPPQHTKKVYTATKKDKIWALVRGAGHIPLPAQWTSPLTPSAATFLSCKVFNNTQACTKAFGRYESCEYGCQHCGCQACAPCTPCWGASPPSWCASRCSACNACRDCDKCSHCNNR